MPSMSEEQKGGLVTVEGERKPTQYICSQATISISQYKNLMKA